MSENTKTPRIRFKGFTDAWEQRKVNEVVASVDTGRSHFQAKMSGKYEILGSTAVIGYDDEFDYQGEFLLTARVGANAGTLYRHSGKVKISDNTVFLQGNNLDFMYYALFNYDLKKLSFGTGQPLVKASELKKLSLILPSSEKEKKYVGRFFEQIDNLITLHQRKCDKLKNIKAALLEKMFPQGEAATPKIRFKGFTDAWEQCELGKIANEVTRTDPESTAPIMMITANNGFIEQSDRYAFDNAGESLKKYILLEKGELAYNHGASKLRPYGSCFALTTVEKARIPFVYHCFSAKNYNSEFLSIELNGENVEKQLRRIVSSGARMDGLLNISFTEYSTITLSLPKRKEQDKISNFFSILDNLITLHQRKQIKQNLGVLPEKCCTKITNSWEQRKLGEIANIQKGQQLGKAEMSSTGTYYVLNGGMEASGFTNQYNTLANTISISEGGNSCGYVSLNLEHFWSGGHNYTLQNLKINTIFLYQWLKRQEKRIMALRVGSGLPNIQKSSLQDVYVKYSTTTEQQAIALFLIKIDNLITLHQRKLKDFHGGFL